MVNISNWVSPLPPVAWIGNSTGNVMRQPARQILRRTLRNRRKKKPSREPWFKTMVSGVLKKGIIQFSHPPGKAGLGTLRAVVSMMLKTSVYEHGPRIQECASHSIGILLGASQLWDGPRCIHTFAEPAQNDEYDETHGRKDRYRNECCPQLAE